MAEEIRKLKMRECYTKLKDSVYVILEHSGLDDGAKAAVLSTLIPEMLNTLMNMNSMAGRHAIRKIAKKLKGEL